MTRKHEWSDRYDINEADLSAVMDILNRACSEDIIDDVVAAEKFIASAWNTIRNRTVPGISEYDSERLTGREMGVIA